MSKGAVLMNNDDQDQEQQPDNDQMNQFLDLAGAGTALTDDQKADGHDFNQKNGLTNEQDSTGFAIDKMIPQNNQQEAVQAVQSAEHAKQGHDRNTPGQPLNHSDVLQQSSLYAAMNANSEAMGREYGTNSDQYKQAQAGAMITGSLEEMKNGTATDQDKQVIQKAESTPGGKKAVQQMATLVNDEDGKGEERLKNHQKDNGKEDQATTGTSVSQTSGPDQASNSLNGPAGTGAGLAGVATAANGLEKMANAVNGSGPSDDNSASQPNAGSSNMTTAQQSKFQQQVNGSLSPSAGTSTSASSSPSQANSQVTIPDQPSSSENRSLDSSTVKADNTSFDHTAEKGLEATKTAVQAGQVNPSQLVAQAGKQAVNQAQAGNTSTAQKMAQGVQNASQDNSRASQLLPEVQAQANADLGQAKQHEDDALER